MTAPTETITVNVDNQVADLKTENLFVTMQESEKIIISLDGSPGPAGVGILVLPVGSDESNVPPSTPIGTVVFIERD